MLTYHTSPPSNNVGVVARRVLFRPRMQARRTSRAWAGTPLVPPPSAIYVRWRMYVSQYVGWMGGSAERQHYLGGANGWFDG